MKYIEEKAIEIIEKFNLDKKTLNVWKSRGKIPDKYLKENAVPTIKATRGDLVIQQRILEIIDLKVLNLKVIEELTGVSTSKLADVRKGKSTLSQDEIKLLKKEITKIRIMILKAFEKKSSIELRNLCNTKLFSLNVILNRNKLEYGRLNDFLRDKASFDLVNYEYVKDSFAKTALMISL